MERVMLRGYRRVERVRFIDFKKEDILFLDFSDSTAEEGTEIINEATGVLKGGPESSLLLLVNVANAEMDSRLAEELELFLIRNRHCIRKQAIVGIGEPQEAAYIAIARLLKSDLASSDNMEDVRKGFPRFNDVEEAKDWLVSDQLYLAISFS